MAERHKDREKDREKRSGMESDMENEDEMGTMGTIDGVDTDDEGVGTKGGVTTAPGDRARRGTENWPNRALESDVEIPDTDPMVGPDADEPLGDDEEIL